VSDRTLAVDAAFAPSERATAHALRAQLADCLSHASGERWAADVRVHDGLDAIAPGDGTRVVIASLRVELDRGDPLPEVAARWRARLSALAPHASAVLVCTIPRGVATPLPARAGAAPSTVERIRRLDRLALELSRETGVAVADVDRIVAWAGARTLGGDPRRPGAPAAEVAAWTIVATFVATGTIDDYAGPGATERARGFLGTLANLPRFVQARLQPR
jgi:hypothetical protein